MPRGLQGVIAASGRPRHAVPIVNALLKMSRRTPFTPCPPDIPRRHRPRGLEILHEDRDVLVVNKEPGLLTMSYHRDAEDTVERILTNYLRKGCARSRHRALVVHRLDRETSGLLVLAKTEEAKQRLKADWKNADKVYVAVVHGHLAQKEGVLSGYLAEDRDQFVHVVHDAQRGRFAQTAYRVIKEAAGVSVLKIKLLTGRKNQIRVQFAAIGHPVVGDPKYGRPGRKLPRMALHAAYLAFQHPFHGARMEFFTPIPGVLRALAPGALPEQISRWDG